MPPLHKLRAGIIGTGFIGPVHIEALKRLGVQVTAICGSTKNAKPPIPCIAGNRSD